MITSIEENKETIPIENTTNQMEVQYPEIEKWEDLDISPELLRGIFSNGFEVPSPIQKRAIVPILKKRDIIAQAQSGTGKTGAFTIGALQSVNLRSNSTQVLIVVPTRELAKQIYKVLENIGSFLSGLKMHCLVGGTSIDEDVYQLRKNTPHIIVGCPGRVHDMIRRNHIKCTSIQLLIVDEADEMLSAGFKDQLYNIFRYMQPDMQVALFSATMPPDVITITEKFMRDPLKILVKTEMLSLEGISQYFVAIEDDNQKYDTLKDLYTSLSVSQCIIFCNSVKRVSYLYDAMLKEGFPVCCIHSGMSKDDRTNAYNEFKSGGMRVLISTDLTARGIDVQQVSVVINFDIPYDVHTYLHRIGRSGRWGRKGVGINFITRHDIQKIRSIEQYYHTQIQELPNSFVQTA